MNSLSYQKVWPVVFLVLRITNIIHQQKPHECKTTFWVQNLSSWSLWVNTLSTWVIKVIMQMLWWYGSFNFRLHCHNQSHPIPFMQTKHCLLIQKLSGSSFDPSLLDTIEIENWLQKRAGDRVRQNENTSVPVINVQNEWFHAFILMIFLWMSNDKNHK